MFKSAILLRPAAAFSPTKTFFYTGYNVTTLDQAREVFNKLGQYGEMIEYKFQRCPETQTYLRYGYVTYKHEEDAQKALVDAFVKVDSPLFKKALEVKIVKGNKKSSE
ncbi:hypothetical protein J3Q64DRAFT_1747728 [Phycomyces blakesleeanus]|uniref:RRM domain-containing protein n=2 Tax=Phycomyces blakesleeanus TaxID=4837 RepID=A0A162U0S4_PHYB8|nr:hypothetical protein PHYBLDRAFT_65408 [Phycomyces blakesleeanus NRRL 1555(-)]OAD72552.1 hypothetical protein PHYBLDRAFT_65408 [Phycomyces blakesleeanus NRRL 1555(-)]|eukprot:XP_018290592.1 hypothetical protein PHYBLDRAFT_65408 [Phycomyces blakesleeanus NRRL 1555(-)]